MPTKLRADSTSDWREDGAQVTLNPTGAWSTLLAYAETTRTGLANPPACKQSDRELFAKNRAAFNVKQRQDYDRQQKVREAAKASRQSKLSRSEKEDRAAAREHDQRRAEQTKEAVREFNEARAKEKMSTNPQPPCE